MSWRYPLTRPYVTDELKRRVCEVLDSGYWTEGAVTRTFEKAVCDYVGCAHAIAVTSCTTGLELALRALGIGPGDEVIVPDFTYPATADVVAIVGATVVLVDIDREMMNIDYEEIHKSITKKTKAIIPVSVFGNPLNWEELRRIKKKYKVAMIEDAACSIGAAYDGIKVGNLADITVFSFHPRKFITTGEGGLITTNDAKKADWMRSYKNFGISWGKNGRQVFCRTGTNYKMSDILAAVGLAQMKKIDTLLKHRLASAKAYIKLLKNYKAIQLQDVHPKGQHAYQSFCVYIRNRDKIIQKMHRRGIETQIGTYALHAYAPFKSKKSFPHAQYAYDHALTLPLYYGMNRNDIRNIVTSLVGEIS